MTSCIVTYHRLCLFRGVAVQNVMVRQRFVWPFFKPTRPHFIFAARRKRKLLGLMGLNPAIILYLNCHSYY
jgi:hypothetical protein